MEPMTPEEEARVELLVQSAVALEQAQSAMVQKIAVTAAVQETEERMAAQAAKAATEAAARAKSDAQKAIDEAVAAAAARFEQEKQQAIDAAQRAQVEQATMLEGLKAQLDELGAHRTLTLTPTLSLTLALP